VGTSTTQNSDLNVRVCNDDGLRMAGHGIPGYYNILVPRRHLWDSYPVRAYLDAKDEFTGGSWTDIPTLAEQFAHIPVLERLRSTFDDI